MKMKKKIENVVVKMIVAYSKNMTIGDNGEIPWHFPEDLKYFKKTTTGHSIVMGRKTWESLPRGFLPDRVNIVMSENYIELNKEHEKSKHWKYGPHFVRSIGEAVFCAKYYGISNDVWVIGGTSIYEQFLERDLVEEVFATEIHEEYTGDATFPVLDPELWKRNEEESSEDFTKVRYTKVG